MKRRMQSALFASQVLILLLLIALAACGMVRGQGLKTQAVAPKPQPVEIDRARLDALRREGFEALYNLDYESARRKFKEMAQQFPDHPAGPQFLAASLWLETLNNSRRLQSGLYNNDSFYAKTEDKADPKATEQFRVWTRQAKQLEEARLKKNPKDAEALYFLGATQGLKAAFEGAVERRFYASLRDGSDAVDHHRDVIKLDPNFHDAELSIGMYDYILGGLPLPFKIVAGITGAHGSKKRGIATLERIAREGAWAQDDAKVLLITLYKREKRFADALAITRELAAKYPRNYLFKLEYADALVSQATAERTAGRQTAATNAEREAFQIYESLLRERQTRDAAAHQLDLIHFQYGDALSTAGQAERAAKEYLAAASVPNAEANLATLARLRAAQSLDLAGKRREALAEYMTVLARPNVYDSQDEAKHGLREPYRKIEVKREDDDK